MFQHIAVLGAGTMGQGVAQLFAASGLNVSLYDPFPDALADAERSIIAWLDALEKQERGTVRYTTDLEQALARAELVIEAVPEQLTLKRELFARMEPMLQETAVIASNTSSCSLESLAEGSRFGDRLVIAHFFNPATIVPLVELVGRDTTRPDILPRLEALLRSCGKTPVTLKRDIPGFIANRLQAAVLREACYLLEQGIADSEEIDMAMTEGPGLRWAYSGPFEISDFGGLDIWERVSERLFPELGVGRTAPELLSDRVQAGKLGFKSGEGIYRYDPDNRGRQQMERDRKLLALVRAKRS